MTTLLAALSFLVLAASIGDVFSTIAALALANVHEANPAVAWVMRLIGPAWVIPRILVALGIIAAALSVPGWPAVAMLAAALALTAYAVWNNLKLAAGA